MQKESDPIDAKRLYTDAPELNSNLLLGSLQLLGWFFFHPSAWCNHISRIDPTLRPDFNLAELNRDQWRNPALRRLLLMIFGVFLLFLITFNVLAMSLLGLSKEAIIVGTAVGACNFLTALVPLSVMTNLALGGAGGISWGIASGLGFGYAANSPGPVTMDLTFGFIFGLGIGLSIGMGGIVPSNVVSRRRDPVARKIGGFIIGALLGGLSSSAVMAFKTVVEFETTNVTNLMIWGILFSVVFGVVIGFQNGWRYAAVLGLAISATTLIAEVIVVNAAVGAVGALIFGTSYSVIFTATAVPPYLLGERMAGPWAGIVAMGMGSGGGWILSTFINNGYPTWPALPASLLFILMGFSLVWLRALWLYPFFMAWNVLLFYADKRRSSNSSAYLRYHSAFWDELQNFRLSSLEEHVLLVMERNSGEGHAALEYLANSRQRWAAQAAQIEMDARYLEHCVDVRAIGESHASLAAGELVGPASALLRSFSRVSQDVNAAMRQDSAYNQRLALAAVEERLDGLIRELTRSSERYALRFRSIAGRWREVVAESVRDLAKTVELRQEIDNPYVIGVPLSIRQEIFVGRSDITTRIEQLLLDRRRPPLLLYGQRRMGKTSLLNNLGRLLPSTIVPLFVDLQGPASRASDHAGFLYNIARSMVDSANWQRSLALPQLHRHSLAQDPFTRFDEWLDEVETALGSNTALLTLDEFESLDTAISQRRYNEDDVLGMLRHLIQHRPKFKVMLAGSHNLEEFQRWSNYLINVQVVHLSYLNEREVRQLVEEPIDNFALRYEPDAGNRIYELTRGHPFLVQLICSEIISIKNEQPPTARRLATIKDVESALPRALLHGSFFFADIERNQISKEGLSLLRLIAEQGESALIDAEFIEQHSPHQTEQTFKSLLRRDLIEKSGGCYRFQVEMIRRWFIATGQ